MWVNTTGDQTKRAAGLAALLCEVTMDERRYQIMGLLGFIAAGIVFIASGINFGDGLTILGSVIWVLSCIVWMIPLVKSKKD